MLNGKFAILLKLVLGMGTSTFTTDFELSESNLERDAKLIKQRTIDIIEPIRLEEHLTRFQAVRMFNESTRF